MAGNQDSGALLVSAGRIMMLRRSLLIATVVVWLVLPLQRALRSAGQAQARGKADNAPQNELNLFLFAGQSNMAGADALIASTGEKDLAAAGEQTHADRNTLFTFGSDFA